MTFAGKVEYNDSSDLAGITVDGDAIEGFAADTLTYVTEEGTIAATTETNAGITILPAYEGVVRILTISEDGESAKTYEITVETEDAECKHQNTETKDAQDATCTEDGYTGDIYCSSCGEKLEEGTVIEKLGHSWDDGVVTKEATKEETGIRTYTCTVCSETKTEEIPTIKDVPSVSLDVTASDGKIVMTGSFDDFENIDKYYEITSKGIVYMRSVSLGRRVLTLQTAGRTKVTFTEYKADGSFIYKLKPLKDDTSYTIRAFLSYTDPDTNKTVNVYSDPIVTSYSDL